MVWISFCGGGSCRFRVIVALLADVAARLTLVPNLYKNEPRFYMDLPQGSLVI